MAPPLMKLLCKPQRLEPIPRGQGLDGRRDSPAIAGLSSQIQSVSKARAVRDAVYSTHAPPPQLPFTSPFPRQPPGLEALPPVPPRLWTLLEREPVLVKSVRRHYHCFIHRFEDAPGREALWRVAMYDVQDGNEMVMVRLISKQPLELDAGRGLRAWA
jgi:hypothetical protein